MNDSPFRDNTTATATTTPISSGINSNNTDIGDHDRTFDSSIKETSKSRIQKFFVNQWLKILTQHFPNHRFRFVQRTDLSVYPIDDHEHEIMDHPQTNTFNDLSFPVIEREDGETDLSLHQQLLCQKKLSRLEEMFKVISGFQSPSFELPHLQKPYGFYLPRLPSRFFLEREVTRNMYLIQVLEENVDLFRRELFSVLPQSAVDLVSPLERPSSNNSMYQPDDHLFVGYTGDGIGEDQQSQMTAGGRWEVFYFFRNFQPFYDNMKRCPQTSMILQSLIEGGYLLGGMMCFSSISPGTRIVPHFGPSNMRLTCHLGLIGCEGARIRVGLQTQDFVKNECIVFDDSYAHEVAHTGPYQRVTLMVDLWHPGLEDVEISSFSSVMKESLGVINQDEFYHSLKAYY